VLSVRTLCSLCQDFIAWRFPNDRLPVTQPKEESECAAHDKRTGNEPPRCGYRLYRHKHDAGGNDQTYRVACEQTYAVSSKGLDGIGLRLVAHSRRLIH
jgi:hypothetical protein